MRRRADMDGPLRPIELSSGFEEIKIQPDGPGTGNTAGATQAGTGSGVAFTWALASSTFWAVIAVEVQATAAAGGILPQQARHRAPATFTRITAAHRGAAYTR